jgi:hypothetical protein
MSIVQHLDVEKAPGARFRFQPWTLRRDGLALLTGNSGGLQHWTSLLL